MKPSQLGYRSVRAAVICIVACVLANPAAGSRFALQDICGPVQIGDRWTYQRTVTDKLEEHAVRVDTFVVAVLSVEHVNGLDYHRVETGELFRTLDDGSVDQYRPEWGDVIPYCDLWRLPPNRGDEETLFYRGVFRGNEASLTRTGPSDVVIGDDFYREVYTFDVVLDEGGGTVTVKPGIGVVRSWMADLEQTDGRILIDYERPTVIPLDSWASVKETP